MQDFRSVSRVLSVVAALTLVATSCGSGLSDTTAVASSTTAPVSASVTTSTSAPPTTVSPPATTEAPTTTPATTSSPTTTEAAVTTTTSVTCLGDGALPAAAANHALAAGDVDGDGLLDTIHTYTIGDPNVRGAWWTQISFAAGGGTAAQIWDESTVFSGATPQDGVDINGDGHDEFFIYLGGRGSEVQIFGLFAVDGCSINRVGFATDTVRSRPATFTVGLGLACEDTDGDGGFDLLISNSGDFLGVFEEDYIVTRTRYSLVDGALVDRGSEVVTVPHSGPIYDNFYGISC